MADAKEVFQVGRLGERSSRVGRVLSVLRRARGWMANSGTMDRLLERSLSSRAQLADDGNHVSVTSVASLHHEQV